MTTSRKLSVRSVREGGDHIVRFSRDVVQELAAIRRDMSSIISASSTTTTPTTPIASLGARETDFSAELLWYRMNEVSGTKLVNSGSYAPGIKDLVTNNLRVGSYGHFDRCVVADDITANRYALPTSGTLPDLGAKAATLLAWYTIGKADSGVATIAYQRIWGCVTAGSASPIEMHITYLGDLLINYTMVGAGAGLLLMPQSFRIWHGAKVMIATTYDGLNVRGYVNGVGYTGPALVDSLNWGLSGAWRLGNRAANDSWPVGQFHTAVAANRVFTDAEIMAAYRKGMGWS